MSINIDPPKLREELINLYSNYLKDKNSVKDIAPKYDGCTYTNEILPKDLSHALNSVTSLYIQELKLTKTQIQKILNQLKDAQTISKYNLVFIADTHGYINDFKKQKEIIQLVDPDVILYEQLQHIKLKTDKDFQKIMKERKISDSTSYNEVRGLIEFCHVKPLPLIGMDLENFGYDEHLQRVINGCTESQPNDVAKLSEIMIKREEHHLKMINTFKDKKVVVILGAWHIQNSSIMEKLDTYAAIYPVDKKLNPVLGPGVNPEEITYKIKTK